MLFQKLAEKFVVEWDLDNMLSKFGEDYYTLTNDNPPYSSPSKTPHWQVYQSGISFARNFFYNFPNESKHLTNKLKELQNTLRALNDRNHLIEIFLNNQISPERVGLMRCSDGKNVDPHRDIYRFMALNIGLRNSNSYKTYIQDVRKSTDFDKNIAENYIMEDGDVYILDTSYAHSVEVINPEISRFIITYSLENIK